MVSGDNYEGDAAPDAGSDTLAELTLPRKLGRAALSAVPWPVVGGYEVLEIAAGSPDAVSDLPTNVSLAALTNVLTKIVSRNW